MQYCNTEKNCKYKHDCCSEQVVVDGDKKCTFSDWCLYQEIIEDDNIENSHESCPWEFFRVVPYFKGFAPAFSCASSRARLKRLFFLAGVAGVNCLPCRPFTSRT